MGRPEANGYMVMSLSIKLGMELVVFIIFYSFPIFELSHILKWSLEQNRDAYLFPGVCHYGLLKFI